MATMDELNRQELIKAMNEVDRHRTSIATYRRVQAKNPHIPKLILLRQEKLEKAQERVRAIMSQLP